MPVIYQSTRHDFVLPSTKIRVGHILPKLDGRSALFFVRMFF